MAERKFIVKDGASNYYLANGGMGGFLSPPGDAENEWSIREIRGGHETGITSLRYVADHPDRFPSAVVAAANRKLAAGKPEMTEAWLHSVYNYFRSCYSRDGVNRNVTGCITNRDNTMPPEYHLAVLHVRFFFPDHAARLDLIAASGPLGDWHKPDAD